MEVLQDTLSKWQVDHHCTLPTTDGFVGIGASLDIWTLADVACGTFTGQHTTQHASAPHQIFVRQCQTCAFDQRAEQALRSTPTDELLAASCRDRLGKPSDLFGASMVRCSLRRQFATHGFPNYPQEVFFVPHRTVEQIAGVSYP